MLNLCNSIRKCLQFTLVDVNIILGGIAMKKYILGLIFIFCVFTTKSAYAKNINIKISNKNYKATLINLKLLELVLIGTAKLKRQPYPWQIKA